MSLPMQKEPEAAVLRKACVAIGWYPETWDLGRVPSVPRWRTAHCAYTVCINKAFYGEHLLSFHESGILVSTGQKVPVCSAPSENLGH